MQKIKFYLPSFTNNLCVNMALVESIKKHGECFDENIEISSFFGTFPNAIWNGGRCEFGMIDIMKFKDIVNFVNSFDIAIRYTFTNSLIREEHLSDGYCNKLMEICNNGKNEVLVNSSLLENYLRLRYPKFKYILSTTALTRGAGAVNKACRNYDLVVADYRDVVNMNFLHEIVMRDKVEILLNESCLLDCNYRESHYEEISRAQLALRDSKAEKRCRYHDVSRFCEAYISKETMRNILIPLGFVNYKIRGREMNSDKLLFEYFRYLVKPQCEKVVYDDIKSYSATFKF